MKRKVTEKPTVEMIEKLEEELHADHFMTEPKPMREPKYWVLHFKPRFKDIGEYMK
jgi:hypothetical protein